MYSITRHTLDFEPKEEENKVETDKEGDASGHHHWTRPSK